MKNFIILILVLFKIMSTYEIACAESNRIDFMDLFEEHGSVMLVIEADTGKIVFANKAAEKFYGYNDIESMTIQQINTLTPDEVEKERSAAAREERNHFIFRHRLANGEIKTVEVYSYPYSFEDRTLLFSIIYDKTDALLLEEQKEMLRTGYHSTAAVLVTSLIVFAAYLYISLKQIKSEKTKLLDSERKNATLISNIQGMVYRCKFDRFWTMEYVSEGAKDLTGYRPEELINNTAIDFNSIIAEEHRQILREKWGSLIKKKHEIFEHEYPIITKCGLKKWVLERGQILYTSSGKIEALEGIITDVSGIKANEEKANEYCEKFYATLLSVGDGMIVTDMSGRIELMNQVAEHLTGWSLNQAYEKDFETIFEIVNEFSGEKTESPVKKAIATQSVVELSNHTLLVSRDGNKYPIEDTAAPIRSINGDIIGCVVVFRDNTEKYKKRKEIEYISYHDYLTGLYNRRYFEEELKRLDNSRNLPISVLLMDINGLKITNDAFGHNIGDKLIKTVAAALNNVCRKNDVVARYGGDEFIVLLLNADEMIAEEIAYRIQDSLKEAKIMDIEVSVSIGWDTKYFEPVSLADIINNAENYMYRKKAVEHLSKKHTVIKSIMNTLLVKSPREEAHSKRVAVLCEKIGLACGLNEEQIKRLKVAGELHDIGKIIVDEKILNKNEKLTEEEWLQIKKHPASGSRILSASIEFNDISEMISSHHERWDGSGYPQGIKGNSIPFESRIIAVADAFDAMTSDRPYRRTLTLDEAVEELKRNSGTMFDQEIVKVFMEKVLWGQAQAY